MDIVSILSCFILISVLSGFAVVCQECAGTREYLIEFNDGGNPENKFVSWHFTNATPNAEEKDLAVLLNGDLQVQEKRFEGRLSLQRTGSTNLVLRNLVQEDSGSYRAVVVGDGVITKLDVQDPCLRSDENKNPAELTCLTTPTSSAAPIIWKDNGEVIQGQTGTTLSNICNGKEDGERTITCKLQNQREAQIKITCSSSVSEPKEDLITTTSSSEQEGNKGKNIVTMSEQEGIKGKNNVAMSEQEGNNALGPGAIAGIAIGAVVVVGAVVGLIIFAKRRNADCKSTSDGKKAPDDHEPEKEEKMALNEKEKQISED